MNTNHTLSGSHQGPACAAFAPLLPLASHHLLEPDEERQLQAHVATCAHCQARLAAYDRLDNALRRRFEPVAMTPLHTKDIMKHLHNQEEAGAFETSEEMPARSLPIEAPAPPLRQRAPSRPRRLVSWVGAAAAVLLIAVITMALAASRHPSSAGPSGSGGTALGSPSGVYFIDSPSGSSTQTFLYALNPANGSPRWRVPVPANVSMYPTLADHGLLYVVAQNNSEGDPNEGDPKAPPDGSRATLKTTLYAFQTSDGKERWHTEIGGAAYLLVLVEGVIYTGAQDGVVYAFDATSGTEYWHRPVGGTPEVAQVVGGVVYVKTTDTPSKTAVSSKLFALSANDGAVKWHYDLQGFVGTVQVSNDLVAVFETKAVAVDASTGEMTLAQGFAMLNAADGTEKWRYQGDPAKVGEVFLEQDTVYLTLLGNPIKKQSSVGLQALNASDGSIRWQKSYDNFSLLHPAQGASDGRVYLASDKTIYVLNAQDGTEAWHTQLDSTLYLQRLAEGILYVEKTGEALYALNAADGSLLWHAPVTNTQILAAANHTLYGLAKTTDAQQNWVLRILALAASTGKELWHYDLKASFSGPLVG